MLRPPGIPLHVQDIAARFQSRVTARRWVLMLAAASVAPLIAGCDSEAGRADRQIEQDIIQGRVALEEGTPDGTTKGQGLLDNAAKNKEASPQFRAYATGVLGQRELDAARANLATIDAMELDLARLSSEIGQLGAQVNTSGALLKSYAKFDPKAARDDIQKKINDAQGGPAKPAWFTHGSSTIPTLSFAKQEISRLEGEIAQRQEKVKQLTDQQNQLLGESENAMRSSELAKGQKSVDEFKRAADLRKKASDVGVDVSQLKAEIVPLQKSLAVGQGQKQALEDVLKQFQDKLAQLDEGWKKIQEQSGAQAKLASSIVQGPEVANADKSTGGSIADKAAKLGRLVTDLQAVRNDADKHLGDASKLFEDARIAAEDLRKGMQEKIDKDPTRPDAAAFKSLQSVVHAQGYALQQATAERMRGDLYASAAASLDARIKLQKSVTDDLKSAEQVAPQDLIQADLDTQKATAIDLAEKAYATANEKLENVKSGSTPEEIKQPAQVAKVLTLYAQSRLARIKGNPDEAKTLLAGAIDERDRAFAEKVPFPPLPDDMGQPPAAPIPPPADPATPPADPATPAAPAS